MGTISIAIMIPLAFAVANLGLQLWAVNAVQRSEPPKPPVLAPTLAHPLHGRIEGAPRTRTDRHDLQLALGHDFATSDVEQRIWPRDPRS